MYLFFILFAMWEKQKNIFFNSDIGYIVLRIKIMWEGWKKSHLSSENIIKVHYHLYTYLMFFKPILDITYIAYKLFVIAIDTIQNNWLQLITEIIAKLKLVEDYKFLFVRDFQHSVFLNEY